MGNKKNKKHFYVVINGNQPGIYHSWEECSAQVTGFPNAKYQGFNSINDAMVFQNKNLNEKCASALTQEYQIQNTDVNTTSGTVLTQWSNVAEHQNSGQIKYSSVTLPNTTSNKRNWGNLTANSGVYPTCLHMPLVTNDCSS